MRRRKLLLLLAGWAVVLCAAGAFVLWPRPPEDRVTRGNYDRLWKGMTRAEVEAILGPPGDYTTGPINPDFGYGGKTVSFATTDHCWRGDHGIIWVSIFNYDAKVYFLFFSPTEKVQRGPLDTILWRAKRQWHRWFSE